MNNHIIVGPGRMCLCGVYDGRPVGCSDVIEALERLEHWATVEQNPSLHAAKGGKYPMPPTSHDLLLITQVLRPLIKDCQ